jgi:DNA replication and repair protein RecF
LRLAWVELRDLRNHVETRLDELPEGLITVAGPNGEGKTNLLEGIAFLFFLQSPRTSSTEPVVRRDADGPAYARGEILTEEAGKVLVEVEIPGRGANRVQVNRSTVRRKRDLRRQVRAVYFGPDDLVIVIGDPSKRREFLDDAIRSLWPLKESAMTAYERTLRQRNRLFKEWEGRGAPTGLEAWDVELVRTEARSSASAPKPRRSPRRRRSTCTSPGTASRATTLRTSWASRSRRPSRLVWPNAGRTSSSGARAWSGRTETT